MSKCENCIHNVICSADAYFKSIEDCEKHCCHFKDKSLFVELPCKVGDDVWFNTFKKNATVCVGIQPHKVDRIDVVFVCDEKQFIETRIPIWQIGKTVFLTKTEAEEKLNEQKRL
jgi:hypothetical protein